MLTCLVYVVLGVEPSFYARSTPPAEHSQPLVLVLEPGLEHVILLPELPES